NKVKQAQNTARLAGESVSDAQEKEFDELLAASVADLVKRQKNLGISLPNDGEYGHAMAADFDYGAWWHYSFARTGGLELHDRNIFEEPANRSTPGNIVLTSFSDRRDRNLFPNVYADANAGADTGAQPQFPKATGPISYIGQKAVAQDIANLKAGLAARSELHDRNIFEEPANRSTPGNIVLTSFSDRRDRNLFPNVYADANAGADTGAQPQFPKATGPISYIGQKAVAQDIANLKAGLAA